MSTVDDQNKKRTVVMPPETRREEEMGREDPTKPKEVVSLKESSKRGKHEPPRVRRSA